jgi:hypothetical protein
MDCGGGKSIKPNIIGRVHRHKLTLQMGGQIGDFDAIFFSYT